MLDGNKGMSGNHLASSGLARSQGNSTPFLPAFSTHFRVSLASSSSVLSVMSHLRAFVSSRHIWLWERYDIHAAIIHSWYHTCHLSLLRERGLVVRYSEQDLNEIPARLHPKSRKGPTYSFHSTPFCEESPHTDLRVIRWPYRYADKHAVQKGFLKLSWFGNHSPVGNANVSSFSGKSNCNGSANTRVCSSDQSYLALQLVMADIRVLAKIRRRVHFGLRARAGAYVKLLLVWGGKIHARSSQVRHHYIGQSSVYENDQFEEPIYSWRSP